MHFEYTMTTVPFFLIEKSIFQNVVIYYLYNIDDLFNPPDITITLIMKLSNTDFVLVSLCWCYFSFGSF
jgi:hypothetical protein